MSTSAKASFSFDEGMRTRSCRAVVALRMRVSMSAMGSVIVIGASPPPSPARLAHARHLAGVDHLPEADAAQPEMAEDSARPPAAPAARVGPHLELGLA